MSVFLTAIGVGGYRSFAGKQTIAPLKQINIIVGPNNCGKSNVLRAIELVASPGKPGGRKANRPGGRLKHYFDRHGTSTTVSIGLEVSRDDFIAAGGATSEPTTGEDLFGRLYSLCRDGDNPAMLWYESNSQGTFDPSISQCRDINAAKAESWEKVTLRLLNSSSGNDESNIRDLLNRVESRRQSIPPVWKVSAFRQIDLTKKSTELLNDGEITGTGVLERLHLLQDPPAAQSSLKADFELFSAFVREVLENSDAIVRVASNQQEIVVEMDGKRFSLDVLGTGIHQVILMGAAFTAIKESIILLEEPETNLHPTLQRKLIQYLENTSNQYFVTTHSAHIADCPGASVFSVKLQNGASVVTNVESDASRWQTAIDLGYRPSDIVLANAIVWVEGPSDRLYVNAWLRERCPDLKEGIHYVVMWYGGSNLAGVSFAEDNLENLVRMLLLNRSTAVLIDSDRSKETDALKPRAARIVDECSSHQGFVCWVTQGREIENYVPLESFKAAVEIVHPLSSKKYLTPEDGRWGQLTKLGDHYVDKVRIAKHLTTVNPQPWDWDWLDLSERVGQLADFLRKANGLLTGGHQ